MKRSLVLVTGSPRSGTSFVARNLHEMGVCMGHEFVAANEGNPLGFFEDPRMVEATERKDPVAWFKTLGQVHGGGGCTGPVGVKTPELAFMDMAALEPDLVIWVHRDLYRVAASLERHMRPRPTRPEAVAIAEKYYQAIEEQLPKSSSFHWFKIRLPTKVSDRVAKSILRRALNAAGVGIEGLISS